MKEIRKTDSISYETVQELVQEFTNRGYIKQIEKRYDTDRPPYVCIASKEEMLSGFNICTEIQAIYRLSILSTDFETIVRISTWIQRYM